VGEVAERARDVIRQICQAREVTIVRGAVPPDHIHLLVSAPPLLSSAKLVQYVKGKSSRQLQEGFPHLRKRYWGQQVWARGNFCAAVGVVDEKTTMEYIENQKWDDEAESFKITESTKS
jgi:putative transposase